MFITNVQLNSGVQCVILCNCDSDTAAGVQTLSHFFSLSTNQTSNTNLELKKGNKGKCNIHNIAWQHFITITILGKPNIKWLLLYEC